jgi:Fic family protein
LLKSGYSYVPYVSHEKLVEDNKADYYLALRQTQTTLRTDNPDLKPWLSFFLAMLHHQAEKAMALLTSESLDRILSPKQLAVWEYLQTVDEASPGDISKNANVARATVNQVLNKLMDLKKIERLGLGSSTRYRKI